MDVGGCVWVVQRFLSNDKWQIKLLSEYFVQITFNLLWMTQTQEMMTHRVSKIYDMDMRQCVWVGDGFLKNDKWEIKLLSEYFSNSHIQPIYEFLKLKKW